MPLKQTTTFSSVLTGYPELQYATTMLEVDVSGKIRSANDHFQRVIGYDVDELHNISFCQLIHPRARHQEYFYQENLASEQRFQDTYRLMTKYHTLVMMNFIVYPIRSVDGGLSFVHIGTNISEDYRRVKLLDSVHRLTTKAFNDMQSPTYVWADLLTEFLLLTHSKHGFIGEVFYEANGKRCLKIDAVVNSSSKLLSRGYEVAKSFHLLVCDSQSIIGQVMCQEQVMICNQIETTASSNHYIPYSHDLNLTRYLCLPIFYLGKLVGICGIANAFEDYDESLVAFLEPLTNTCGLLISNIRQVRQLGMLSELDQIKKLEEMQQHLIHYSRNALMGEVFASISQQWQQPLAASVLNISVVVNKINELDVGDEVKSFLKQRLSVVQEVLNNKASLVTDFIDFSNPSRMRYRFNLLTSVIASLSLFETTLASHQIKVSYHIDASCELFGIESEFRQVIINIIKNAIDQFASAKIDTPWIHLSAECSDGDVMIEVRDNGGGIADDILPVLFDAYVTTKSDGVGLGLYMVKTIIVEHFGGQIKAFSSDIGTLFSMLIPASMGD